MNGKKHFYLGLLFLFSLISCFNHVNLTDNPVKQNSDGTVTVKLSARNEFVEARTIAPDAKLYFTVIGSTVKDTTSGEADYAPEAAEIGTAIFDTVTPYFPEEINKIKGLEFKVRGNSTWYFTAYGTIEKPETIYGAAATDAEKIAEIKNASCLSGTLQFYVESNGTDEPGLYTDDSMTTPLPNLIIDVSMDGSASEKGFFIIPISLPQRDTGHKWDVDKIYINLTDTSSNSLQAEIGVTTSDSSATTFAVKGSAKPGVYDVTIRYMNSTAGKDLAEFYEKLTVWPKIESNIIFNTDNEAQIVYKDVTYTNLKSFDYDFDSLAVNVGADEVVTAATQKGFSPSSTEIESWIRRIFYVRGGANKLSESANPTGSIFAPFDNVADAVVAMKSVLANWDYTEFSIVLDGSPTDTTLDLSLPLGINKDVSLVLRTLDSSPVTLSNKIINVITPNTNKYVVSFDKICTATNSTVNVGTEDFIVLKGSELAGPTVLKNAQADLSQEGIINIKAVDNAGKVTDIRPEINYWAYNKSILRLSNWDKDDENTYLSTGFAEEDFVLNEASTKVGGNLVFVMGEDTSDSDKKGQQIIKYFNDDYSIVWTEGALSAIDKVSTNSISSSTLALGAQSITNTISVLSNDPDNYSAIDGTILANLAYSISVVDGEGGELTALDLIQAGVPALVAGATASSADYQIVLTLNPTLSYLVAEKGADYVFVLTIHYKVGEIEYNTPYTITITND